VCSSSGEEKAYAVILIVAFVAVFVAVPLALIARSRWYRWLALAVWIVAIGLGALPLTAWDDGSGVEYWYFGLAFAWLAGAFAAALLGRFLLAPVGLLGAAAPSAGAIVALIAGILLGEICLS
jgi:hypothetical protein